MNAVDTNVFVYSLESNEPIKRAKAEALLDELVTQSETLLLWQVAAEFLSCLRRWEAAGEISTADAQGYFDEALDFFPLQIPSPRVFAIAFDLHSRFSLSHWDSMLLAACKDAGIDTLYSEDMDPGTDYDGLTIINPFV